MYCPVEQTILSDNCAEATKFVGGLLPTRTIYYANYDTTYYGDGIPNKDTAIVLTALPSSTQGILYKIQVIEDGAFGQSQGNANGLVKSENQMFNFSIPQFTALNRNFLEKAKFGRFVFIVPLANGLTEVYGYQAGLKFMSSAEYNTGQTFEQAVQAPFYVFGEPNALEKPRLLQVGLTQDTTIAYLETRLA